MKKILFFILITSSLLLADALPTSINATVKNIDNGTIQLSKNIPAGMSGIVIHNYGNGLSAITHSTVSLGKEKASIEEHTAIKHSNIPNIQTAVTVGDQIIFGNFYDNVLVIAPNRIAYQQITKKFKRIWIHPDAFALDFMQAGETKMSMDVLERFSKKNQVGLVLVVASEKLLVIDPISKQVIGSTKLKTNPNSAVIPFYARFKQVNLAFFNFSEQDYTPYFQSMAGLK